MFADTFMPIVWIKFANKFIDTGCYAVGARIFKNKFMCFVIVYFLPTQQSAQTYSWKGGSKLHAASVNSKTNWIESSTSFF